MSHKNSVSLLLPISFRQKDYRNTGLVLNAHTEFRENLGSQIFDLLTMASLQEFLTIYLLRVKQESKKIWFPKFISTNYFYHDTLLTRVRSLYHVATVTSRVTAAIQY